MAPTITRLSIVLSAMLLGGCAGTSGDTDSLQGQLARNRYELGLAVTEIRDYRLTGWNAVDERHLIIHTGPSDSYLISLTVTCRNLRTAEDIALSTTAGSVTHLDKVIVHDRPTGVTEHCPIESIHALERLPAAAGSDG